MPRNQAGSLIHMRLLLAHREAPPRDPGEVWRRVRGTEPVQRAPQAVVIFAATILSVRRRGAVAYWLVVAVVVSLCRCASVSLAPINGC